MHITTDSLHTGMMGQLAIIDFYHCEGDDLQIAPAPGWTLHKTIHIDRLTVVRFTRIVTAQEFSSTWTFSRPAEVAYEIDYF